MTEGAADLELPVCSRCGKPYRPSHWNREYLCPVCGAPLQGREVRRVGFRWRPGVAVGLGALILCGGAARIILDRRAAARPAATQPAVSPESAPTDIPPRLGSRVQEKIRLLESDLALAPQNSALLARMAECQLLLAMFYRDRKDSPRVEKHLSLSRRHLQRLRQVDFPAARELSRQIEGFPNLTWGPPRIAGPSEPRGEGRRSIRLGVPGGGSFGGAVPQPGTPGTPLSAEANNSPPGTLQLPESGTSAPAVPVPSLPPMGAAGSEASGGPEGGSPFPRAVLPPGPMGDNRGPRAIPSVIPDHGLIDPARADGLRSNLLKQVSQQVSVARKYPADVNVVVQLGELYERLAERAGSPRPFDRATLTPEEQQWLRRALQVYLDAAKRTRLRTHRAMFLDYAADIHGRLRDWEAQYGTLQQAVTTMPTSPILWRKLQAVCLLTGRRDEYRKARRAAREWALPTPELPRAESAFSVPPPWR